MRRLLLLAIALIVYGSLYPWHFHPAADPWAILWRGWPERFDLWTLRDAILNVALYTPLGFAAAAVALRRMPKAAAFAVGTIGGLALSVTMELLQVYVPGRVSSMADVVTNGVGSACGAVLGLLFARRLRTARRLDLRRIPASALLLGAVWGCYRLYPFFPVVGRSKVEREIAAMFHAAPHPVEIWMQTAEWIAVAAIVEFAWAEANALWMAAAMVVLPLQFFLLDRTFTLDELLGAALALGICAMTGKGLRAKVAVGAIGSAIVLRELSPFHLLTWPQPFNWIPFAATFSSGRDTSVVIIAGKAFDYGAMVWLLRRVRAPFWAAAVAMAAALMALEWFQRLLPGRTPETTDAALTLIMAFALWKLDRKRHV